MNHYYLIASLPTLALGDPPPLTAADLQRRCANLLSEREREDLACALDGRVAACRDAFAARWVQAETQVRNAVARVRAGKWGAEPGAHVKEHAGFDVCLEEAVTDAYAKGDPLQRELDLDRTRWRVLDDLVCTEPFGFAALLAYALKLLLAARWAALTDEEGEKQLTARLDGMEQPGSAEEAA